MSNVLKIVMDKGPYQPGGTVKGVVVLTSKKGFKLHNKSKGLTKNADNRVIFVFVKGMYSSVSVYFSVLERCTSHVTHHTSHTTHHTSHSTHHTSHITHHAPHTHITHHTSHIAHHTSHHKSHITHHTSHITHHTSHMCNGVSEGKLQ